MKWIALFCIIGVLSLAYLADQVLCAPPPGLGGALDLDVFDFGKKDDKGFRIIDAGAFINSRRSGGGGGGGGRGGGSFGPRGAAGPRGAPGFPGQSGGVAPPRRSVTVDLCYLVDITGSMGPYIEDVKTSIREVVDYLVRETGEVGALRLCFIGYRDLGEEESQRIQVLPFTTDVSAFLAFVDKVRATGGGDLPEDIYGGLQAIGRQSWQSRKRIIMHIADAPCHGDGCGGGTKDPLSRNADDMFRPIRAEKLKYNFGRIKPATDTMLKLFAEAYGREIPAFNVARSSGGGGGGGGGGGSFGAGGSKGSPGRRIPGLPGLPGPREEFIGPPTAAGKNKVGEASIAAVLLGISD